MSIMKFCKNNIKIIFIIIMICFLFSLLAGVGTYFIYEKSMKVALVDGEKITREAFEKAKISILEQNSKNQNFDEKYLNERVFHTLSQGIIFFNLGKKIGEKADKREVSNYIMSFAPFQKDGKFDFNTYIRILRYNKEKVFTFEKKVEKMIVAEKMKAFIAYGINVSDNEIDLEYEELKGKLDKEKFKEAYFSNKQAIALKDFYEGYIEKIKPKIYEIFLYRYKRRR